MNLKKYIGIVYKDIVMDEKEGHFNDLPKYVYDVKIEKTVGDEWIETGSAFVTYTHPRIYQKVEVHYLKDNEVIHKEIGVCMLQLRKIDENSCNEHPASLKISPDLVEL